MRSRLSLIALLCAVAVLYMPGVAPAHPGTLNVASGRPATASSSYGGGQQANKLTDGIRRDNRWQTDFNDPNLQASSVWWAVDLGEGANISKVNITFDAWVWMLPHALNRYYSVPKTIVIEALVSDASCGGSPPKWVRQRVVTSDEMPVGGAPYALDHPDRSFNLPATVKATAVRLRFPDGNQPLSAETKPPAHVSLSEVEVVGEWAPPCPQ